LVTPVISSVELAVAGVAVPSNKTSTRVKDRVEKLEAKGLTKEAAYLRKTFPDVFDERGQATTEKINYGILIRIEKILDLLEKLLAQREAEAKKE
jgi:hypothetical protein